MKPPALSPAKPAAPAVPAAPSRYRRKRGSTLLAHGEPAVWLTGGALVVALAMIVGLLLLIVIQGTTTFWPSPVVQLRTIDGKVYLGEVARAESYRPEPAVFDALPPALRDDVHAQVEAAGGKARRWLLRTGNYDLTGTHHHWVSDFAVADETQPEWSLVIERLTWGNFYGTPTAFLEDGTVVATAPAEVWARYRAVADAVYARRQQRRAIERDDMGALSRAENDARLAARSAEIRHGASSPAHAAAQAQYAEVRRHAQTERTQLTEVIDALNRENARYQIRLATADGQEKTLPIDQIVRAYPANQLTFGEALGVYLSRWREYLGDRPRESNTEGGVYPAIWGTVAMTLLMSLTVVPFGVLAALYLREYARSGPIISAVRIAINNLAGVPSIVYGVFGLGFFCYLVGAWIDGGPARIQVNPMPPAQWWLTFAGAVLLGLVAFVAAIASGRPRRRTTRVGSLLGWGAALLWLGMATLAIVLFIRTPYFSGFYQADLPSPTFGKGGLLWAALTLALLTLPVVIVSTEEALAAVPNSMREGSYACGASKWQTIRRIVLPRAMPGVMTGMILAMARGAGEVAPLMLVGAVKLAPELPVDGAFPFIHPSRSFMHLGYHIFDVGFQSPNSEAGRPMVYTTTLLLIVIVALLNLLAVWLRSRLRRRYLGSQF